MRSLASRILCDTAPRGLHAARHADTTFGATPAAPDLDEMATAPDPNAATQVAAPRIRPLAEVPELVAAAANLLRTHTASFDLSDAEARVVAGYMGLVFFPRGATLFREGDRTNTQHMLLLLTGEVAVDTADATKHGAVAISVLGPGNLIGEMGVLDGSPRSAQCSAATAVQAASLTRTSLQRLIVEHPAIGAKLMVAIAQRIAERLRGLSDQLELYGQLNASLQAKVQQLEAERSLR
jgi:CRP-like cAMP-binding protein